MTRWTHACLTALAVSAATAWFAAGCSSSNASTPAPLTQCPATLAEANGAACSGALVCPYLFPCGALPQQATCSCGAGGAMGCVADATDASVARGGSPSCATLPGAGSCPSSEPVNLAACSTIGLVCLYAAPTCAADAGVFDTCQCQSDEDGGLAYSCSLGECAPHDAGPALDGGAVSDSGKDGSSDAGDEGGGADAAPQDAGDEGG